MDRRISEQHRNEQEGFFLRGAQAPQGGNMDKCYVVMITAQNRWYKRYKTIDGWTKDKTEAWIFTERSAKDISDRLNRGNLNADRLYFEKEKVIKI